MIHHHEHDRRRLVLGAVASGTGVPAARQHPTPGPDGPRAGDGTPVSAVSADPHRAYLQGLDDGAREDRRNHLRERRAGGAVVLVLAVLLAGLVITLGWPQWYGAMALGMAASGIWSVSSAALGLRRMSW